jgi:hypothetical protein
MTINNISEEPDIVTCYECCTNIVPDDALWIRFTQYAQSRRHRFAEYVLSEPFGVRPSSQHEWDTDVLVAYCDACAVVCCSCEQSFESDDVIEGPDWQYRCGDCHWEMFFTCERCDNTFSNSRSRYDSDSGSSFCPDCYDEVVCEYDSHNGNIESYGHTNINTDARFRFREWTVTGIRTHYDVPAKFPALGFELETNTSDYTRRGDAADFMLDEVPENYLVIKEDGSVSGFEMVTFPADLRSHMELFPWEKLPKLAGDYSMTSWRGSNCGLHVHISKSAFTPSHIWRYMNFHDHNAYGLSLFAGRDSQQWARFGKSDYESRLRQARGLERTERYVAVNTCPEHTYELRYFRGSLRPDTVKAYLEFTHALWAWTKDLSYADVRNGALLTMHKFIAFARNNTEQYPHLYPRLDSRVLNPA